MIRFIAAFYVFIQAFLSFFGSTTETGKTWHFKDVPYFQSGVICDTVYDTGSGLLSDIEVVPEKSGKMQLVSSLERKDFEIYRAMLDKKEFSEVYSNDTGAVTCSAYRKNGKLYYLYYCEKLGEARFIEDNVTKNFEDFGYTYSEGTSATVYQFDYPYVDPVQKTDKELYSTNGMLYIIRLADNSLVVIDGGSIKQSSNQNIEECMKFMRKITGTEEGEKVRIALWYGTHGHSDHVTFFYKLLGFHYADIDLERVMFNYPSHAIIAHAPRVDMFRERLALLYPGVKYLAPHTGMSFNIANMKIDVLYTHEDAVSALDGTTPIENANDSSMVCRLSANGKSFLVLGDLNILGEEKIANIYGNEVFQADVLQAAHHFFNANPIIFENSKSAWVLCPISQGRAKASFPGYMTAKNFYADEQLLFADDSLYGIELCDELTLTVDRTQCGPYDGSSMNRIK